MVQATQLFDDAMSGAPTIQADSTKPTVRARDQRSFMRFLLPTLIFVCGALVGVGATVTVIEYRMFPPFGPPSPQRIVADLKSELALDADQSRQVEAIVRTHDAELRRIFGATQADRKRFEAEVAAVLNESQKEKWRQRCEQMQKRFPHHPPDAAP
jgi:hypothetical protein